MSIQKIRTSILVAAGVVALAVAGLVAGRLSAGAFSAGPYPSHMRADFPTRFARIARALDLTEDQKAKIKDVLKSHAEEIRARLQASADARRALRAAVNAQPADETAIRAAAQQLGQAQGDGAVLFSKIRGEVDPILTAEQKERIQKFQEKMRQRGQAALQSFDNFVKSGS